MRVAIISLCLIISEVTLGASCEYEKVETLFATPHTACRTPLTRHQCAELDGSEGVTKSSFSDTPCDLGRAIGVCELGDIAVVYYSGDDRAMEIRCAQRGGHWRAHDGTLL